jgi:hypothetical protein
MNQACKPSPISYLRSIPILSYYLGLHLVFFNSHFICITPKVLTCLAYLLILNFIATIKFVNEFRICSMLSFGMVRRVALLRTGIPPEDDSLHSDYRENLISYIPIIC